MHDMCGVHYLEALLLSQVAGLLMSAFDPKRTSDEVPVGTTVQYLPRLVFR